MGSGKERVWLGRCGRWGGGCGEKKEKGSRVGEGLGARVAWVSKCE